LILTRPDSGIHTVKDLKGRRFGLPDWAAAQIDFTRAQALRGLENALKLEGLQVGDVALVNYRYDGTFSDRPVRNVAGTPVSSTQSEGRNLELAGLLRGEVDAIFLKGASAVQLAHAFALRTVIDTGNHPDPLIRSNNGTPRTLAVDSHLLAQHPQVVHTLGCCAPSAGPISTDETRRYLARNQQQRVLGARAYGTDAHLRLSTAWTNRPLPPCRTLSSSSTLALHPGALRGARLDRRQPLDQLLAPTSMEGNPLPHDQAPGNPLVHPQPVPTGLGIAVQSGRLAEALRRSAPISSRCANPANAGCARPITTITCRTRCATAVTSRRSGPTPAASIPACWGCRGVMRCG
jgi:2'-hydroxybiphenyl-2-sulfinate desulfinase